MTAFDHIADSYDNEFTHSAVGALQRQKVWDYLNKELRGEPMSILELNCGTGEDAVHFAGQGHEVIATDLSPEMLTMAGSKAVKLGLQEQITFLKCDINEIGKMDFKRKFDLIFSDFGGLNCVDAMALKKLSKVASRLLKNNGRFIGVIMPAFSVWESAYFLAKVKGKTAFRRASKGPLKVIINNEAVETWYYSPQRIRRIFKEEFNLVASKPIGFFLPPSYMQNYFQNRMNFLNRLDRLEDMANKLPVLAGLSDHFLIDLELKKSTIR